MTKDYTMQALYLDEGQPTFVHVCATDVLDAHSEVWLKLPENRHKQVDTFKIVSISACTHKKGKVT